MTGGRKSPYPSKGWGGASRTWQGEQKANAPNLLPPMKEIDTIIRGNYIGGDTLNK